MPPHVAACVPHIAACVRHVAAHDLGAAAYAIEAVRAAAGDQGDEAARSECRWQREQLPDDVRELVLDDQQRRNHLCRSAFEVQPVTPVPGPGPP